MSKITLVIVTADTCGACQKFKRDILPQLLTDIKTIPNINVVQINLNHTQENIPANYPSGLTKFIGFFPSFLITETKNYTSNNMNNFNSVKIYGGSINAQGEIDISRDKYKLALDSIKKWIETEQQNIIIKDYNPQIQTFSDAKVYTISTTGSKNLVNN